MNPKGTNTATGGLTSESSCKGGIRNADHIDVPYSWIYRIDPHYMPKPPLCQVTVSSLLDPVA